LENFNLFYNLLRSDLGSGKMIPGPADKKGLDPGSALVSVIDISQYRLLFGFFLLYTDRVPFELLDSAALL
jgi:hypothetical protein